MLIAAGYGWGIGHYLPSNSSIVVYAFQFIIITALLIMGIKFLSFAETENHTGDWSVTGLSIFSIFSLLLIILTIVHPAFTPFSATRNTFADLLPVSILMTGNGMWIITTARSSRHAAKTQYISKSDYNIL